MQSPREDDEHNGKSLKAKRMGAQLRRLRARHRKTLKEVAQEAGLSVSFLSALERGDTGASVASLRAVAKVYGATMREIFGADLRKSSRLVRPGDRPVMEWDNGVRYEELADSRSLMDPTYVYVPPNASSGGFYSHDGEEFMYVLSGTVFVELEGEGRHRLEAKDTFYWPSTIPHRWWTEDEEAEILYVNTPPTF
jgi:transcriptional regulator with XRE-family HTH domain